MNWRKTPEGKAKLAAYRREWDKKIRALPDDDPRKIKLLARGRKQYNDNKDKRREQQNTYYANNKRHIRRLRQQKEFGISLEDNEALGYNCHICGVEVGQGNQDKDRHIDHCHSTGKVRGVLCSSCNMGLGKFKDSSELLIRAARYLEKKC